MNHTVLLNSTLGEYRVTEFLGAGGMGEVYRAVHQRVGHEVAIKVLSPTNHASDFEKFVEEARIQAGLRHPNIATFYGFLEDQGRCCIVMEYVAGQTLSDRIRLQGKLPVNEALTVFRGIVEAVAFIHQHRVIHRDIKASNVRLGLHGQVKLLDFGIAKAATTPQFTVTGKVMGTLQCLSPERLRGAPADERSDIWALGVLLYEILTGQVPFAANSIADLCTQTSKGSYLLPSVLNPAVPREVEAIITRCLKKHAAERYPSAQALLVDVRCVLAARPEPSAASGLKQWLTSLRVPFSVRYVWLVIVLLVAIGIYVLWPIPPSGALRRVKIETNDGAAEAYSNDRALGQTPIEFEAALGETITIRLERDGFHAKEFPLQVNDTQNDYVYTLEKIRHP
jgi:serine/threonine protein kinase